MYSSAAAAQYYAATHSTECPQCGGTGQVPPSDTTKIDGFAQEHGVSQEEMSRKQAERNEKANQS